MPLYRHAFDIAAAPPAFSIAVLISMAEKVQNMCTRVNTILTYEVNGKCTLHK